MREKEICKVRESFELSNQSNLNSPILMGFQKPKNPYFQGQLKNPSPNYSPENDWHAWFLGLKSIWFFAYTWSIVYMRSEKKTISYVKQLLWLNNF